MTASAGCDLGHAYHPPMSREAHAKWEIRYRSGDVVTEPSSFVEVLEPLLTARSRPLAALDVAGGAGRHALWLAEQGCDVTLVDISPTALSLASEAARGRGLHLTTVHSDLDGDPLPAGPWDVILCFHYLQRSLFAEMIARLAPGGLLVYAVATKRNLERHDRPPLPFLLDPGEAPSLAAGLEIVYEFEGWTETGRHEARVIAQRPAADVMSHP